MGFEGSSQHGLDNVMKDVCACLLTGAQSERSCCLQVPPVRLWLQTPLLGGLTEKLSDS